MRRVELLLIFFVLYGLCAELLKPSKDEEKNSQSRESLFPLKIVLWVSERDAYALMEGSRGRKKRPFSRAGRIAIEFVLMVKEGVSKFPPFREMACVCLMKWERKWMDFPFSPLKLQFLYIY